MSDRSLGGRECGNRHGLLVRAAVRAAAGVPHNLAHPLPSVPAPLPEAWTRTVDPEALVASFAANARAVSTVVHLVEGTAVDDGLLHELIRAEGVRRAVVSCAPGAVETGRRLANLGVEVQTYSPGAAADADLGVTCPVAGIAATGSVVQDSSVDGGRGASLVPRVHLALLSARTIVTGTRQILGPLSSRAQLPSNLVLTTGPSRTGDIELLITLGVHGPVRLHVAVLEAGRHE